MSDCFDHGLDAYERRYNGDDDYGSYERINYRQLVEVSYEKNEGY